MTKPKNATPLRFDMSGIIEKLKRKTSKHVGSVTLSLPPFVSISINPEDLEVKIARELVVELSDRRVLSATECCDNCVDKALKSLGEIRSIVVKKQVALVDLQDGPLFALIEIMAQGIRDFQTYEELLNEPEAPPPESKFSDFYRPPDVHQAYREGLEILRGHLSRCLGQIAVIAKMELPDRNKVLQSRQTDWPLEVYLTDDGGQKRIT